MHVCFCRGSNLLKGSCWRCIVGNGLRFFGRCFRCVDVMLEGPGYLGLSFLMISGSSSSLISGNVLSSLEMSALGEGLKFSFSRSMVFSTLAMLSMSKWSFSSSFPKIPSQYSLNSFSFSSALWAFLSPESPVAFRYWAFCLLFPWNRLIDLKNLLGSLSVFGEDRGLRAYKYTGRPR